MLPAVNNQHLKVCIASMAPVEGGAEGAAESVLVGGLEAGLD
jgi:hypothetical protein